jgi:predicted transcriptional regulator YheO
MLDTFTKTFLEQLAKGVAGHFGDNCEVVVHDLTEDAEHTIVDIENGQVTGRTIGDGSSRIVLEAMSKKPEELQDRVNYLTQTEDGKILKSSTIFIRDENKTIIAIFSINYDITNFILMDYSLKNILKTNDGEDEPEKITNGVNELLDGLITESVKIINKPVSQMNRDDKIRAVRFLHDSGAFLIKKSGEKVSKFFGISKYTLYNYIDFKET